MKTLCIYHGNCADGFGAAWVVRRALGDDVEFFAATYQQDPPDVTGRDVIMVDFSYKRPVLEGMIEQCASLLILDHHKTAEADLAFLPPPLPFGTKSDYKAQALFDMERSGAMIAWNYFFPEEPDKEAPMLIQHIHDRDLWKFELEGTREIQAALFSFPYDFDVWDELFDVDNPDGLFTQGQAIDRKHFKDINEFIVAAGNRMVILGYDVPCLNAPYMWSSDAGHIMAEGEKFAACYWDTADGRIFSLRSADDGMDVSAIAKVFGGGGHKHAAGFKLAITPSILRSGSGSGAAPKD